MSFNAGHNKWVPWHLANTIKGIPHHHTASESLIRNSDQYTEKKRCKKIVPFGVQQLVTGAFFYHKKVHSTALRYVLTNEPEEKDIAKTSAFRRHVYRLAVLGSLLTKNVIYYSLLVSNVTLLLYLFFYLLLTSTTLKYLGVFFSTQILVWAFWVNYLGYFFSVWVIFVLPRSRVRRNNPVFG